MEPIVKSQSLARFLTFRVDAQLYALPADEVTEVIRLPAVARVPQGPAALLGIANLRGSVLPIASLRQLLGKPATADATNARAIVLDIGAPVALVVDSVETLEAVGEEGIETRKKELSAEGAEELVGAFSTGADKAVAKILDIRKLIESAFTQRARPDRQAHLAGSSVVEAQDAATRATEVLVTFEVAGQEFALPLDVVREILPMPSAVSGVARAETVVLGITSVRDSLLPLLSLRSLLGFPPAQVSENREKVVVMKVAGTQVGLVADRARAVLAAELDLVDPIPPVLAARTGGESRIKSIYRSESGQRLISILAPDQLFREDVMQRLLAGQKTQSAQSSLSESHDRAELIFVVFRLGDDEFGLPIESVVEVAQVPSQISRVPKAPKFLEGVVNLRGEVLPVVDQRRRFDLPKLESAESRKLVVMRTERHRAGLIVDSVSDVLRVFPENVSPAPDLTESTARLVRGVINLEGSKRIVLLLDPTEVLTRAEQSLLDTFQGAGKKANA